MPLLRRVASLWQNLVHHERVEHDLNDEMRAMVDLLIDAKVRAGMRPEDARRAAMMELGVESVKEEVRSVRAGAFIDTLTQDVRYAIRGLQREPLVSGFVIATLALAIGANAAMFGVVDRLLIRGPWYVKDADHVVRLFRVSHPQGRPDVTAGQLEYVQYDHLRTSTQSFEQMAAYANFGQNQYVTASFFPLLGVRPLIGRFFTEEEDQPANPQRVIVLGYGLWQREFGGDTGVVGRTVMTDTQWYTIVGVAPRGFTGADLGAIEAWYPLSTVFPFNFNGNFKDWATSWTSTGGWLHVIGRLKPRISREQAGIDATATHQHTYDGTNATMGHADFTVARLGMTNQAQEATETTISRWLTGVTLVVLLIACANVINLLLVRAARRRREIAVRLALGARRGRLVRLLLTESIILATAGGIASIIVAYAAGQLMRTMLLPAMAWPSSPVDLRVLAVTASLAITVGLVTGLVPALNAGRVELTHALKTGASSVSPTWSYARDVLTVAQAALSVVLLVAAGLFVHSLWKIHTLDFGFDPDRVLTYNLTTDQTLPVRWDPVQTQQTLDRIRHLPGVERATLSLGVPLGSSLGTAGIPVAGTDTVLTMGQGLPRVISIVADDYFATVGTRLVRGRTFTRDDREGTEPVAIVSETMARTLWPDRDAIGQCFFVMDVKSPCSRVVGIVHDIHYTALSEAPSLHYYVPFGQASYGHPQLLVRPTGGAKAFIPTLRGALLAIDPSASMYYPPTTLQAQFDPQTRPWYLGVTMFGLCGVLALVVAAIGLYSVVAYLVTQRTRDIGIRIALGARDANVLALVMWHGVGMAIIGVVVGLGLATAGGRFVQPLLFDTSPHDPTVLTVVAVTLVAVAMLASLHPAIRARRVDPVVVLREE